MKRKTSILLIIFTFFTLFSTSVISPTLVSAASTLNYKQPNGDSPFKFKLENFLNPQMAMSVVGCTGVVNKVSKAIQVLLQPQKLKAAIKEMKIQIKDQSCYAAQISAGTSVSTVPNMNIQDPVLKKECNEIRNKDTKAYDLAWKQISSEKTNQTVDQCLNGIAVTLAKNQLVQMTRSTMNWINTGFDGNPMYVRNMQDLVSNISNNIQVRELDMFKDANGNYNTADYPYGREYSIAAIRSDQSAKNIGDSLKQDLTNYIYTDTTDTDKAKQIQKFSNNFSTGGWSGWLALTQHPQNNPLGFTMLKSEDTTKKKDAAITAIKEEASNGKGFLDQKVCKVWGVTNKIANINLIEAKAKDAQSNDNKKCTKWVTVTPGSLIKDKTSTYINSPERQLELVKTINDSLNTLFTSLIDRFRFNGLASLGTGDTSYSDVSGGFGSNTITDVTGNIDSTTNSGGYKNDDFDLTKDLGNSYYHVSMKSLGSWDASTNKTDKGEILYIDTTPYDENANPVYNAYYTVSKKGNTVLFKDGYNGWDVGDRVYFDGNHWQNWKKEKGVSSKSFPIKTRGVLQTQQDYIVAAKELLRHLPGIMPKIGELDYCIPGPNPSWEANYSDNYKIFSTFVGAVNTNYKAGSLFKKKYVTIDFPVGSDFLDFKSMYNGTDLWSKVTDTDIYKRIYELTHLKNAKRKGSKRIAEANKWIEDLNSKMGTDFITFSKDYKKVIDETYGSDSPMQKQYIEKENTPDLIENPSWLQMASDGLNITKNMIPYNEDITTKAQQYKDDIAQANLNIYKLKTIGNKVRDIVKAAQDRRDEKLASLSKYSKENIAGERIKKGDLVYGESVDASGRTVLKKYNSSLASIGITPIGTADDTINKGSSGEITKGSISNWTIPAICKKEEGVDYKDNKDILVDFGGSKDERCNDGIDNDLDGLIDQKDPDCSGYNNYDTSNDLIPTGSCVDGESVQYDTTNGEIPDSIPDSSSYQSCTSRTDYFTCLNSPSYVGSGLIDCNWDPASTNGGNYSGGGGGDNNNYGSNY